MAGSMSTQAVDERVGEVHLELERQAFLNLLQMTNTVSSPKEIAWQLVILAQQLSGCEAVAIRLKDGPDFPYAASLGFSDRFVALENSLCEVDEDGHLVRDGSRQPVLACVCGRVLTGQVDPTLPCFTPCGSFVTSSASSLVSDQAMTGRFGHLRGRCHTAGYETVALFPIRRDGVTYGLIHCNDPHPGRISSADAELMEHLAETAAHLFQQAMA
jgi:GAF domain-containing protein